jgi:hypothetical protein
MPRKMPLLQTGSEEVLHTVSFQTFNILQQSILVLVAQPDSSRAMGDIQSAFQNI